MPMAFVEVLPLRELSDRDVRCPTKAASVIEIAEVSIPYEAKL